MIKRTSTVLGIFLTTLCTFNAPTASAAEDCNLKRSSKETVSCLQRQLASLENKISQSGSTNTSSISLPKGAVIAFNAKECPNGWVDYKEKQNKGAESSSSKLIKCEKA